MVNMDRIAALERELFLLKEQATNAAVAREVDTLTPETRRDHLAAAFANPVPHETRGGDGQFLALHPVQPPLPPPPPAPLRLDLGCGIKPKEGFTGVDVRPFPGVSIVADLVKDRWPWADDSVEEAHCSHMVEHIPRERRPHFFNELWRVLKPGARCTMVTPHWASTRAYGDITHEWPPVAPMFLAYLDKEWRKTTPHCDVFTCDFQSTHGFTINQRLSGRNQAYVQAASEDHIDSADDMVATLVKVVR